MDSLKNYKYIKNLLSQDLREFITSSPLRSFDNVKADAKIPLSFAIHSSEMSIYRQLLHFVKPKIEVATKLTLLPIYAYSRFYLAGSSLFRHKDRPACEISVSLTLTTKYDINKNYVWPLYMNDTPLNIKEGDAVVYRGRDVEHWRPVFEEADGSWHHQVFLHYIDSNGPCTTLKEEINNRNRSFNEREQLRIEKREKLN